MVAMCGGQWGFDILLAVVGDTGRVRTTEGAAW